ncbi:MAG: hypothetical protein IT158_15505 [Bryobacterales bacterium]|nr:hypothetical protein [Bryobacterales bacterium]
MSWICRDWTPADADEWTREDWITIVISPLVYVLLMVGTGLSLFLIPAGYITLAAGVVLTGLMHWIIDPKLKVISGEYEKKQRDYLEQLEKQARWEGNNG